MTNEPRTPESRYEGGVYRDGCGGEFPCTCPPACPNDCKGECGCVACREAYSDFLSTLGSC